MFKEIFAGVALWAIIGLLSIGAVALAAKLGWLAQLAEALGK